MVEFSKIIQTITIVAPTLLLAVILHETAHGLVAEKLGDPTARIMGRITLNPVPHIDPVWTVLIPLVLIVSGSRFIIGGAKPVPINPLNFRNPRRDMMWVSLSGPATNLALAIVSAMLFHTMKQAAGDLPSEFFLKILRPVLSMLYVSVLINVVLAVFNLIPVPPLDGSKILMGILPLELSEKMARLEPYGMLILIILIFTNVLFRVINPIIGLILRMLL
ncbi:MAG: site-2 protease family protein [Deltaproteobacteria bacterium]|nr:site-2 protease family protein [Deltaproteobacteria bacterium]